MYFAIGSALLDNVMLFQNVIPSKNPREGRCRNGNKMKDLKFANVESIDTVSEIYKQKTEK